MSKLKPKNRAAAPLMVLIVKFVYHKKERSPYWLAVFIFLCPYAGFVVSAFPYIVPYNITLWQAAAPANSLRFLLVGMVIMLPVLLFYTGYAYHIFKGGQYEIEVIPLTEILKGRRL